MGTPVVTTGADKALKADSHLNVTAKALGHNEPSLETIFKFVKLPGETRNQIYKLVLVSPGPIKIRRHVDESRLEALKRIGHSPKRRSQWVEFLLNATTTTVEGGRKRALSLAKLHTPALLLVSKQVNSEATGIFYGLNQFMFENMSSFMLFARKIGPRRSLLADIVINHTSFASRRKWNKGEFTLDFLRAAKNLRRLEITIDAVGGTLSQLADKLLCYVVKPAFDLRSCSSRCNCVLLTAQERKEMLDKVEVRLSSKQIDAAKIKAAVLAWWQKDIDRKLRLGHDTT